MHNVPYKSYTLPPVNRYKHPNTMNAQEKDRQLGRRIVNAIDGTPGRLHLADNAIEAARTLRRAQLTLHRWAEEMCNGTIQRAGEQCDGQPFRHYGTGTKGPFLTVKCPDREAGALRRVAEVCKAAGLHYYHQTDPRGCALYVSAEPLTDQNYSSRGVACL